MPGPRIPVLVYGPGLPESGQRYGGYRTAVRELNLGRNAGKRDEDRQELKRDVTLRIKGYTIKRDN